MNQNKVKEVDTKYTKFDELLCMGAPGGVAGGSLF